MKSPAWLTCLVAGGACLLAPSAPVFALMPIPGPGTVSGRVVDASDRHAIVGAEVQFLGPDTLTLRTDAQGTWRAQRVTPGRYTVRTRVLGYAASTVTVVVADDQQVERTIALDATPLALDQVVVTAARREQRLKDAVVTTELISRADIERTGATDIASVLLEQTGIELQGGHPAGTGVMLQGIGSERVLVLLDGQPMAGRISGVFDISRIPVTMIERVEVVRGPQSTLYGTDAMGGVVNIITRTAPKSAGPLYGLGVRGTFGTQARTDGAASLTYSQGALSATTDLSRRQTAMTPGMSGTVGAQTARSDVAAKIRYAPDSSKALEASVLGLDERQRWLAGSLYNFGDNRQWSGRLNGTITPDVARRHRVSLTLSGSNYDHLQRASTETRPIAGDTGSRQIQRVYQLDAIYNARLTNAVALDLGTQVRRDKVETERVLGGRRDITLYEPYAQVEAALTPTLSVVPGLRLTQNSQWGTHLTPRVAARQRLGEHLTLRASYGTGFRAPDFKELYMRFVNSSAGYAVNGNPDLRPESSRNVMGGAEWATPRSYVRVQAFRNDFVDFIETRAVSAPGAPAIYEYGNISDGSTQGLDLESGFALAGFRGEGSISTLSTRDDNTGRSLLSRPDFSARATVGLPAIFDVRVSFTGVYTGRTPMERDETTGAIISWREAYPRLDLRVARRIGLLTGTPELVFGMDNAFDTQPAQWAGFNRRHIYTSFSWTFNRTPTR
ncbi:MAG TPA: TonB-dependent receptor [Gemmatimonas aurantiaca]|uniref:TonB-dependent outer membrane transport protein n=2 Tax=Gemmatimonas aurantiaca TaxID=173480 RepID=C1AAB7_GEMAT|nr:TonB-dependent receptor [Gemmatimonas aurantiaca]BAH39715.1 TonB-dependent outer membrane transport protein [Gemmatimonas aurantiaca T-27]HCT58275.1 TonB-dependent receptor [Gemmatimonas aurantiaca]